jgi:hypothetical protein
MPIVLKSWSLNFLEHSGPVQACAGIALPLPLPLFCAFALYLFYIIFCFLFFAIGLLTRHINKQECDLFLLLFFLFLLLLSYTTA